MVLVDTNILAYLLIQGDHTTAAQNLYSLDPDWRSEAFIMVEFSNILATYVRTKAMTRQQAVSLLAEAHALIPATETVKHEQALDTANEYSISAYDARFITVAKQLRLKLITEDTKLRNAVPDWTIPL